MPVCVCQRSVYVYLCLCYSIMLDPMCCSTGICVTVIGMPVRMLLSVLHVFLCLRYDPVLSYQCTCLLLLRCYVGMDTLVLFPTYVSPVYHGTVAAARVLLSVSCCSFLVVLHGSVFLLYCIAMSPTVRYVVMLIYTDTPACTA